MNVVKKQNENYEISPKKLIHEILLNEIKLSKLEHNFKL